MKIEPTTVLNVDGKNVQVSTLAIQYRQQVEVLDTMRQNLADSAIQTEAYTMAVNVKTLHLQEVVRQLMAAQDQADADAIMKQEEAATESKKK